MASISPTRNQDAHHCPSKSCFFNARWYSPVHSYGMVDLFPQGYSDSEGFEEIWSKSILGWHSKPRLSSHLDTDSFLVPLKIRWRATPSDIVLGFSDCWKLWCHSWTSQIREPVPPWDCSLTWLWRKGTISFFIMVFGSHAAMLRAYFLILPELLLVG